MGRKSKRNHPRAAKPRSRSRFLRRAALVCGGVGLLGAGALIMDGCAATGAAATGKRLEGMRRSPQWKDGTFVNTLREQPMPFWSTLWAWAKGAPNERPEQPVPIVQRRAEDFAAPPASGLRITWLGHSSQLIEIDGQRLLLDPLWAKRASPFTTMGPQRFHEPPLPLDQLPDLNAVVISHDHYDHLDRTAIIALNKRGLRFVVPLGVGAHLEHWGVDTQRIVELDWWGETKVGDLTLVATPARHFSGRSMVMADRNKTLWAGWAIIGPQHRVFYSGDTAMFPGLAEIGRRLGPFDATMIETGAYDQRWVDVHLGPEQAVDAHRQLRGKLLIPVHWGTFALGIHSWTEPIERVAAAAQRHNVTLATPRPGESVEPANNLPQARWWPTLPWRTAEQNPVRSSGLTTPQAALTER